MRIGEPTRPSDSVVVRLPNPFTAIAREGKTQMQASDRQVGVEGALTLRGHSFFLDSKSARSPWLAFAREEQEKSRRCGFWRDPNLDRVCVTEIVRLGIPYCDAHDDSGTAE